MAKDYAKQKKISGSNSRNRVMQRKNTTGLWLLTGILIGLFIAGLAYLNNHKQSSNTNAETVKNIAHKAPKKTFSTKETAKLRQPKFDFYTILPKMKVWVPTNNEQNLATHKPQPPAMAATKPPAAIINIPETDSSPSNVQEAATTIETSSQAKATSQTKTVQAKTTTSQVKTTSQAKTVSQTKATASQAKTVTHYLLQVASLQNHHEVDQLKAQLLLMGYNVVVKTTQSNHKTLNRVWVGPYTSSAEAAKVKQILAQQHLKSILVKKND